MWVLCVLWHLALVEIILDHIKGRHDDKKEGGSSVRMTQIYSAVKVEIYLGVQEFAVRKTTNVRVYIFTNDL